MAELSMMPGFWPTSTQKIQSTKNKHNKSVIIP